jgi:N-acyl-D-amino-acid deacylase
MTRTADAGCLITNARILDPESGADFYGSLVVLDGKIAAVYSGPACTPNGARVVDAGGGLLVPGFIDTHAHTDNDMGCAEKLLAMGVTTAYSGNCGMGPEALPDFFAHFREQGYPVHQAEQAGHSVLRKASGQDNVYAPLSAAQTRKLKVLIEEAFGAGAAGLSFGLEYTPGATPEEVRELAECAFSAGKTVSIHTRLCPNPEDSIEEALMLCESGGRVIISHLVYMYLGDSLKRVLDRIETYRAKGADLWIDSGMYTAFATFAGTPVFDEAVVTGKNFNFAKLRAATGKYAGQYLDWEKYLDVRGNSPNDSFIYDPGRSEDIFTAYSLSDVMVSTDCMGYPRGQGHPQGAATYPYFFRLLVKEQTRLSLLDAVRRCTFTPACALGLAGKGRISAGADADIVVLDWERLREKADFPGSGDPDAEPEGIMHVFVNGRQAIENGKRIPEVLAGVLL